MLITFEKALTHMYGPGAKRLQPRENARYLIDADRRAKRIVFDDDSVYALCEMELKRPRNVIAQMHAPMPFDYFTLQIPLRDLIGELSKTLRYQHSPESSVGYLTYLVTPERDIYVAAGSELYPQGTLLPVVYKIGDNVPYDNLMLDLIQRNINITDRVTKAVQVTLEPDEAIAFYCCGSLISGFKDGAEMVEAMPRVVPIWLDSAHKIDKSIVYEFVGQFRYLFTALAVMNMPKSVVQVEAPAARYRIGNKYHAAPRHRKVVIKLSEFREELVGLKEPSNRKPHGEHEVRGHWMHFGIDPDCDHTWVDIPGLKKRSYCSKCKGRRTHRAEHKRGNAEFGVITHEYHARP